jgi:hypothetical protein
MKKQIVTIVLGGAVMLATATSLFAQTSGVAVGGGAAGGLTVSTRTRTVTTATMCTTQWYNESSVKHLSARTSISE